MLLKIKSKELIPFVGEPIWKVETDLIPTEKETNYMLTREFQDKGTYHLGTDRDFLEHKEIARIKEGQQNLFSQYLDILGIQDDFYISNSWVTLNNKTGHINHHRHLNSVLSCVYYPHCSEGDGIRIISRTSTLQNGWNITFNRTRPTIFNCREWTIPVRPGTFLFFPSHLFHFGEPSLENDRIVIATQYMIKGNFGSDETYDRIEIC